jgi:hypothetical protein
VSQRASERAGRVSSRGIELERDCAREGLSSRGIELERD